jgi:hypothetical protein
MTLPEICPLDENQTCKGQECHLFCLEWRTKEPICLIGYSTTGKTRPSKANPNEDTYAERTFRKLSKKPTTISRMKNVSEKGDWIPRRFAEDPQTKPVEKNEEKPVQNADSRKMSFESPDPDSKKNREKLRERQNFTEAENASVRLESRLKKEPEEENPIIFAKIQPNSQQSPRIPEKVVSKDKQTTIFVPYDAEKKKENYPPESEIKTENKERSKKPDKDKEIDLPDVYDEEFWT